MASYITKTLNKFSEMHQRHSRYTGMISLQRTSSLDPRTFVKYSTEGLLVGMDGPVAELTNKLSKCDHVSILGMGGMGKTVLAQAVYDKIKGGFHCEAFVHIGLRADVMKVLVDIFEEFHIDICGHKSDQHELISQLQNFLVDKRCLFVIGDIWDKETCYLVQGLFKGSVGSKIITTTRDLNIAKGVGGAVYTMKPLCPADSKRLFWAKAGPASHHAELDIVAHKILRKCGGVPIAITMIGSLLNKEQSKEWHRVYESIGFDGHKEFEHIKLVFAHSYYALPYNIKKCFLYLGLFRKDQYIEKNMLIWRWVAEGLVSDGLFETGENYFNELLDRGMIQWAVSPGDVGQGGCRVQDLMLDLIHDLSSSENFSTLLGMKQQCASRTGPIHRLAIHKGQDQNTRLEVGEVLSFYAACAPAVAYHHSKGLNSCV
nr:toMV resistance protein Tm-2(GCR236)-like isoform X1 [Aegilops tauschii subsp. strangulata]